MNIGRRPFLLGASALGLSGCVPAIGRPGAFGPSRDPAFLPTPNASYDAWMEGFRARALAQGIDAATLERGLAGAGYLPGVVERDRNQTEFRRSTEDYLAIVASDEDVALGRQRYGPVLPILQEIEGRYGVPPQIMAAVWGVESAYGTRLGDIPVISATSTLAWEGRRGRFFEAQLVAALRILQNGDTTFDRMVGSWAGAMGHTQLIPTTFEEYAVDFRGDGRRDIWVTDPTDGLASTANYLARFGWQRGAPWGLEVRLPEGFDTGLAGRDNRRSVAAWDGLGVRRPDGRPLPDHGAAHIHAPAGTGGPGFLLFRNFDVILRYNASTNYGIGVGYLSDRIAGGGPLEIAFGPDTTGLTQVERRRLQARLNAAGFDAGTPDGVIGPRTEAAIRAFEASTGRAETGRPSQALLAALG